MQSFLTEITRGSRSWKRKEWTWSEFQGFSLSFGYYGSSIRSLDILPEECSKFVLSKHHFQTRSRKFCNFYKRGLTLIFGFFIQGPPLVFPGLLNDHEIWNTNKIHSDITLYFDIINFSSCFSFFRDISQFLSVWIEAGYLFVSIDNIPNIPWPYVPCNSLLQLPFPTGLARIYLVVVYHNCEQFQFYQISLRIPWI